MNFLEPILFVMVALDPGLGTFLALFVFMALLPWAMRGRCRRCKRFFAMKATGKERDDPIFSAIKYTEWLCQHCGYQEFRKEMDRS